jgi:hypothetical protein
MILAPNGVRFFEPRGTGMDPWDAIVVVPQEGAAFVALLTTDGLSAEVAGCPGWTVADLARHLGGIHRWACQVSDSLAVDGIDEVVSMFLPRQLRLNRLQAGPERVDLVCESGPTFTVATAPGRKSTTADATIVGAAESLLLLLWKRIPISDSRLTVTGSFPPPRLCWESD